MLRLTVSALSPPASRRSGGWVDEFLFETESSNEKAHFRDRSARCGHGRGTAIASHVTEVDPATVPVGFLAAHNRVAEVPGLRLCACGCG